MKSIQLIDLTERQQHWGEVIFLVSFTILWAALLRVDPLLSFPTEGVTLETFKQVGILLLLLTTALTTILRSVRVSREQNSHCQRG